MAITYEDGTVPEIKDVVESGASFKLIPNNTELDCRIVGVIYVEGKVYANGVDEKDPVLQVKLEVTETGEYKGIVVDHNVKLWDMGRSFGKPNDPIKARKNRDKAIDFLIKYDSLSGEHIARHKKQWYELIGEMNEWFAGTPVKAKFGIFEQKNTMPDGREINRDVQFVSSITSTTATTQQPQQPKRPPAPPAPPSKPTAKPAVNNDSEFDGDVQF